MIPSKRQKLTPRFCTLRTPAFNRHKRLLPTATITSNYINIDSTSCTDSETKPEVSLRKDSTIELNNVSSSTQNTYNVFNANSDIGINISSDALKIIPLDELEHEVQNAVPTDKISNEANDINQAAPMERHDSTDNPNQSTLDCTNEVDSCTSFEHINQVIIEAIKVLYNVSSLTMSL